MGAELRDRVSSWILMSCQQHRVISGLKQQRKTAAPEDKTWSLEIFFDQESISKDIPLCAQVNSLQFENDALKKRVAELEKLKDRSDLEEYMKNNRVHWHSQLSSARVVLGMFLSTIKSAFKFVMIFTYAMRISRF